MDFESKSELPAVIAAALQEKIEQLNRQPASNGDIDLAISELYFDAINSIRQGVGSSKIAYSIRRLKPTLLLKTAQKAKGQKEILFGDMLNSVVDSSASIGSENEFSEELALAKYSQVVFAVGQENVDFMIASMALGDDPVHTVGPYLSFDKQLNPTSDLLVRVQHIVTTVESDTIRKRAKRLKKKMVDFYDRDFIEERTAELLLGPVQAGHILAFNSLQPPWRADWYVSQFPASIEKTCEVALETLSDLERSQTPKQFDRKRAALRKRVSRIRKKLAKRTS